MRLVAGYDPRIMNVPLIQEAALQQGAEGLQEQLQSVHYVINWGMMTLQDGIDFSVMGIGVTSEVQRFTDGIRSAPGAFPVVGPKSHVAVITRERGFEWITRPELHAQGAQ